MTGRAEMSERHEVRVRGANSTIVFVADSADGRLIIRQEPAGKEAAEVCSISLSNPDELRDFFSGLQRVVASLGEPVTGAARKLPDQPPVRGARLPRAAEEQDREALVAQARTRNPQAFAPWTREEEEEIRQRHARGETIQAIARARRRSPRAIELRLQRLGVLPPE
ncbi:MAG TPA: hypothetical protein VG454_16950 [Gemmatimonadales bacterium]|nr:hypothetical protein [Gemmatimonadales bacterium]